MSPPDVHRPAVVVAGWTVASRPGRVWLHPVSLAADGDLTPATAEALAVALAGLLALAPPELAAQVRGELTAAGLDPDATGWPPADG